MTRQVTITIKVEGAAEFPGLSPFPNDHDAPIEIQVNQTTIEARVVSFEVHNDALRGKGCEYTLISLEPRKQPKQ